MIIAICGFKGVGKSTVADYIAQRYKFDKIAFADSLKDVVSTVFGWERNLIEGDFHREWREEQDEYWSNIFNKNITPRNAMQDIGTMFRENYDKDFWINVLLSRIQQNRSYVISDLRYMNEKNKIKSHFPNTVVIRIEMMHNIENSLNNMSINMHQSETEHLDITPDYIICNDGDIQDLYNNIDQIIQSM